MFGNDERDRKIAYLERQIEDLKFEARWLKELHINGYAFDLKDVIRALIEHQGLCVNVKPAQKAEVVLVPEKTETKKSK